MNSRVNLDRAGEAEAFGALALRLRARKSRRAENGSHPTPAQRRAISALVCSVLDFARLAGAARRRVRVGSVSLKLHEQGSEEILSVRKLVGA